MPKTESVQSLGLVEGATGPTDLVQDLIRLHVVVQQELTQPGVNSCHGPGIWDKQQFFWGQGIRDDIGKPPEIVLDDLVCQHIFCPASLPLTIDQKQIWSVGQHKDYVQVFPFYIKLCQNQFYISIV